MPVFQRSIVDQAGNVMPLASVEVRDQVTSSLVQLYSNYALSAAIGNPIAADSNGFVRFYVAAGRYQIVATSGALTRTWEDEVLGLDASLIEYGRTAAEIAASVTPTAKQYATEPEYNIKRLGASFANTNAQNKTALQSAITVAAASPGAASLCGVVIVVPPDCHYGRKTSDSSTWPVFSGSTPIIIIDYSQGSSYAGFPTAYDGAQMIVWTYTPQTTAAVTFTGTIASAATSATLTGNWAGITGQWATTFSNGDVRNVTFTNGATTATWATGLSSGATASATYVNPGQHDGNTFWLRGAWAPAMCTSNDMDLAAASTPTRLATDNRRSNYATMVDGIATYQFGQGTHVGGGYTEEELSNLSIQKFSMAGDTLGAYSPFTVQRMTGNISYGGGRNIPGAHHHFERVTSSPSLAITMAESNSANSAITIRNSTGVSVDWDLQNTAGQYQLISAGVGVAMAVQHSTRNVMFGTATDDPTAIVNETSTTKGHLFPSMTTTQRDAISSPSNGLAIYNSTTAKLQIRAGGAWVDLH